REGALHQYPCHIVALQSIFSISNARRLQCHNVEAENIEGPIPVTLNEYICLIALLIFQLMHMLLKHPAEWMYSESIFVVDPPKRRGDSA
ncbi:hypothetical protein, partial [Enterobacter hormaechei]|uniref:hypothetical protein n=1 Tax=Enterobacter hormaechei TaxID=158836 RepID=UPI00298C08AA